MTILQCFRKHTKTFLIIVVILFLILLAVGAYMGPDELWRPPPWMERKEPRP
jgi:hypothetical protein